MTADSRVHRVVARFDEANARIPRVTAARQGFSRTTTAWAKRIAALAMAFVGLLVATVAFGLIVGPIGLGGVFTVVLLGIIVAGLMLYAGREKPIVDYREDMPNKAVVERLGTLLTRKRTALPAPAASRIDAISAQLPLLESRLSETQLLDPLAQDARRLMGKHLPELIERYERVPAPYRRERDAEGLSVDDRLVQGLDAAKTALDDLCRKLAREDVDAFQTQGRFIESRYKADGSLESD